MPSGYPRPASPRLSRAHRLPPPPAPRRGRHDRGALLHRGERRPLPRGRRGGGDRRARRLRAHPPLHPGARDLATTRSGANRRHDDLDAYCEFVRGTPLRLGIEMDFVPGAEDRTATLLEARDFDYVVGSVHFLGDDAVDHEGFDVWEGERRPRPGLAPLLRDARRGRPLGPLRHPRPPRPGQGLGAGPGRCPSATRAPTTSPRSRRSPRAASRSRSRPPACASRSASSTRRRAFAEMCVEAGAAFALSSDAHLPEQVGYDYERAVEFLAARASSEICVFERRERRLEPLGMSRVGIGYDSHRFAAGRRLVLGGVEIEHELGLEGHSDADVLTHAVIDALLGAAGLGDIGTLFPDDDERWRDADSIDLLRTVVGMLARPDRQRRRDRDLRGAAARPATGPRWSGTSPRRPRRGSASRRPPTRAWAGSAAARESPASRCAVGGERIVFALGMGSLRSIGSSGPQDRSADMPFDVKVAARGRASSA